MRTMRLSMAVMVALALLTGLSAAIVAQNDEEAVQPPVESSGSLAYCDDLEWGRIRPVFVGQFDGGSLVRRETRGSVMRTSADEVSDPRMEGTWMVYVNMDEYIRVLMDSQPYPGLGTVTVRVENNEGAWQGSGMEPHVPGVPLPEWGTLVLVGEEAYEGLLAVMANHYVDEPCGWEVRGFIVEGRLPPMPELPAE